MGARALRKIEIKNMGNLFLVRVLEEAILKICRFSKKKEENSSILEEVSP